MINLKGFWVATVSCAISLVFGGAVNAHGWNAVGCGAVHGAEVLLPRFFELDEPIALLAEWDYEVNAWGYESPEALDPIIVQRNALCLLIEQVESWGYPLPGNHICHNGAVRLFPYRMLLERLERAFDANTVLTGEQMEVLGKLYDQILEMVRLLISDVSKLDEDEPYHIADVLGLLLRARFCSFSTRSWAFHLGFQRYLAEDQLHVRIDYINAWARALATVSLPEHYVHQIREALLACMNENKARQVQQAAAHAMGSLLGHVDLDNAYRAELLGSLVDFVFKHKCDAHGVRSVIEAMRRALAGKALSVEIRTLIFDVLLCVGQPDYLPQVVCANQFYLIDRSLLDLWAEGLRNGWFTREEVNTLVPYIMEFRFVRNCPIRTQGVVAALTGLIHARAEDSTFRQLVYGAIGEILMGVGQREEILHAGVEHLSLLFALPELPYWERAQIIAYFSALLPKCTGYYLSVALMEALCDALKRPALTTWERGELLGLLRNLCAFEASYLDARVSDIVEALHYLFDEGSLSVNEEALMIDILEALPSEEDDLDYSDDDDLGVAV